MDTIQKRMLIIFSIILIIAAAATFFVVRQKAMDDASDYAAPDFEKDAASGEPEDIEESLHYSKLEIDDGFAVSMCGSLTVEQNGQADIYFTSDKDNLVWVRLVLLSEDGEELGSTGILKPNEYVRSVRLETIPSESESVVCKILSYEPETYYSCGSASAKVVIQQP